MSKKPPLVVSHPDPASRASTARYVRAKYLPVFTTQGALYNPPNADIERSAQAYVEHVLAAA